MSPAAAAAAAAAAAPPRPAAAALLAAAAGAGGLQAAIASRAGALRHVDKENAALAKAGAPAAGAGAGASGGDGLGELMRRGLADRFRHARPVEQADASLIDSTGTWESVVR